MENTLIPRPCLPAVEAALLQTFGSNTIDGIELLSGGLSGSGVYKLTIQQRPYVLKLDAPSAEGAPALSLASAAGIAPRLHFREAAAGITITDFIESLPLKTAFSPYPSLSPSGPRSPAENNGNGRWFFAIKSADRLRR